MDINRNNYEHYFLLYIDRELTAAERKAVEAFAEEHTDLAQELQMLQQTVLTDEPVCFNGKEHLLKTADARREELLLLLDGELTAAAAAALHSEINADTQLQKEWALLQRTRLPQETIIFEHKDLLRKKPARIIPAGWLRAAAAALVLGIIGTAALLTNNNRPATDAIVAKGSSTPATAPGSNTGSSPATASGTGTAATSSATTAAAPGASAPYTAGSDAAQQAAATGTTDTKSIARSNAVQRTAPAAQSNPLPQNSTAAAAERLENFNREESNKTNTAAVTPAETITLPAAKDPVTTGIERGSTKAAAETALQQNSNAAVYAVNTPEKAETFDQLAPDDRKFRRSGLARKVSRFFQRSRKKADNDGLKIAGFEFAVR